MNTYEFSLVLSGVDETTPNLDDALFEAGCDDGLVCTYNNTVYVDFMREAINYKQAVMSAIKNVESAGLNARVISVDAGDLVGISDIAQLSELSKKTISAYKDGKRGKGNFPSPIQRIKNTSPIWRWSDVATWLAEHGKIDIELAKNALITEAINQALQQRNPKPIVKELVNKLQAVAM
ncbi:DNA-binding protein [Pseudoalteromonas sp. FUC4]|uniref:helix-turn-helix transcriptional regulator n=1 Tax=Pseudoalteromonas sp. FUC4 TaxID=2511201 RepID=UPI0011F11ACC|nr:DNA-binding protein [Pseudoalteromonas sp. FUC4]KAA1155317.1 DNA-binding protein [Pseudoalteromonas sp. FUC4]